MFQHMKFMQYLLKKYGHASMVFMDATDSFTQYKEAKLFILSVKKRRL